MKNGKIMFHADLAVTELSTNVVCIRMQLFFVLFILPEYESTLRYDVLSYEQFVN